MMTTVTLSVKRNEFSLQKAREKVRDYLSLTKPGITATVSMTVLAGFLLASKGHSTPWQFLFHTLFATALVSAGAGTLNMLSERESDSLMHRTLHRPIPSGRISPQAAFFWGALLSSLGIVHLAAQVNLISSFMAASALMIYLVFYTPLKKITPFCTVVGAVSGAMPALIGWSAASGRFSTNALPLFLILFFWQFPHLYALAWMYREDYRRANFKMVLEKESNGLSISKLSFFFALLLIPVSALPTFQGLTNALYLLLAIALGIGFAGTALYFVIRQNDFSARILFKSSLLYLPLLLFFLVLT